MDVSHFAAVDAVAHLRHAQAQELYNLRVFLLVNNHFGRRREARERLRHLGRRARRASLARATSGKHFFVSLSLNCKTSLLRHLYKTADSRPRVDVATPNAPTKSHNRTSAENGDTSMRQSVPSFRPPPPTTREASRLLNDERLLEKLPHGVGGLRPLRQPRLDGGSVQVRLLRHGIVPAQLLCG